MLITGQIDSVYAAR